MKERAAVSKGQHTVQGSELAAFAVRSSGWDTMERQNSSIMTIFHLRLSLCGLICYVLLPPEAGTGTCPAETPPGNKTKQYNILLHLTMVLPSTTGQSQAH